MRQASVFRAAMEVLLLPLRSASSGSSLGLAEFFSPFGPFMCVSWLEQTWGQEDGGGLEG